MLNQFYQQKLSESEVAFHDLAGPFKTRVQKGPKLHLNYLGKEMDWYHQEVRQYLITAKGLEFEVITFKVTEDDYKRMKANKPFLVHIYLAEGTCIGTYSTHIELDPEVELEILEDFSKTQEDEASPELSEEPPEVVLLPGLDQIVWHPAQHEPCQLREAVISLNDSYGWSREKIADWLETLDVDITFKIG